MWSRILGPALLLAVAAVAALVVPGWCAWSGDSRVTPTPQQEVIAPAAAVTYSRNTGPAPAGVSPAGETARRIEVLAADLWLVRGCVTDHHCQPVPDARVRARAFRGTAVVGEPAVEALLTTDASGDFVWRLGPPAGMTCVELRNEDERVYADRKTFVVAPGDPPPPPFHLWIFRLDVKVTGRVLDAQGRPLVGAHVGNQLEEGARTDGTGRFELPWSRRFGYGSMPPRTASCR